MDLYREAFMDYLKVEKGLAQNSILSYNRDLNIYLDCLKNKNIATPSLVSQKDIVDFLFQMRSRVSSSSISRMLSTVKGFHRFLLREKIITTDPTALLETPRVEKKIPSFLTLQEVTDILKAVDMRNHHGMRDKAILEIMYATGMRVSETADLKYADVNMEIGFIKCKGKGSKERIIPLGKTASSYIQKYLLRSRPILLKGKDHHNLFVAQGARHLSRKWNNED